MQYFLFDQCLRGALFVCDESQITVQRFQTQDCTGAAETVLTSRTSECQLDPNVSSISRLLEAPSCGSTSSAEQLHVPLLLMLVTFASMKIVSESLDCREISQGLKLCGCVVASFALHMCSTIAREFI